MINLEFNRPVSAEEAADLILKCQKYAQELRKQFPHMKWMRICRKVALKYKVKLTEDEPKQSSQSVTSGDKETHS